MKKLTAKQKTSYIRLRTGESRLILITGDILMAILALFISLYFWGQDDWLNFSWQFLVERPPFWYYLMPVLWILLLIDLYEIHRANRIEDTIKGVSLAALISLIIYLVIYFSSSPNSLPRQGVAIFILAVYFMTLIWRLLYIRIFTAPLFMSRVIILGAGRAGITLANVIQQLWPLPFYLVGFVDDDEKKVGSKIVNLPVLGSSNALTEIIDNENISDLVFAISGDLNPEMFQAIIAAGENGINVTTMPIMYEDLLGRVPILLLQSDWLVRSFLSQSHTGSLFQMAKRLMDIIGSLIGLFILIILFPLVSILILIDNGSPVIYKQGRIGKNGKLYEIYKFRSMYKDAEIDGKAKYAVENDKRITKIGRILRKTHIDELPQFINILRGDMSLVGPRPEREEHVNKLQKEVPFYRARFLVKPGLTGWAQINYGYASTKEDNTIKLEYDLYYIKHRNLILDVLILLRTIGTAVGFRGL